MQQNVSNKNHKPKPEVDFFIKMAVFCFFYNFTISGAFEFSVGFNEFESNIF